MNEDEETESYEIDRHIERQQMKQGHHARNKSKFADTKERKERS